MTVGGEASKPTAAGRWPRRPSFLTDALASGVCVLALILILWQARGEIGLCWDEPPDIERVLSIRTWLGQVFGSAEQRSRALSAEGLRASWPFTQAAPHEHPPVYAWLSLLSSSATEWLLGPMRGYRLSTVLLFSITSGVMFAFVRERWGLCAAIAGVAALVGNPRLFADGQLVTLDVPLAAMWFFAAVAFLKSCESGKRLWLFGALSGLAVMSKATGVLVFPAMLLWTFLARPPHAWRQLLYAIVIAPVAAILVHPGWWTQPVSGPMGWAKALLDYQQKIPVYYFGKVYDSRTEFVPWHQALVALGTMLPIGLLVLGLCGVIAFVRRFRPANLSEAPAALTAHRLSDSAVVAWALCSPVILMALRVAGYVPAHDGLRQLDAALVSFAVVAAYGARALIGSASASPELGSAAAAGSTGAVATKRSARLAGLLIVFLCAGHSVWTTGRYHPFELAYYNELIGGPAGAKAAGMESTYYWDTLTQDVLGWLNANLKPGATVLIYPPPDVRSFAWLQRWGMLRRDVAFVNLDSPQSNELLGRFGADGNMLMVFQMRQGLYMPRRKGGTEVFARLAEGPAEFELKPAQVGVRLLAVFDGGQFKNAVEAGSTAAAD